jgi:hypothetical protein
MGFRHTLCGAVIATTATMVATAPALADSWKDESRRSPHAYLDGEWKEEWHDGRCTYERKWKPSGAYKEETKCEGYEYPYRVRPTVVAPLRPAPAVIISIPFD